MKRLSIIALSVLLAACSSGGSGSGVSAPVSGVGGAAAVTLDPSFEVGEFEYVIGTAPGPDDKVYGIQYKIDGDLYISLNKDLEDSAKDTILFLSHEAILEEKFDEVKAAAGTYTYKGQAFDRSLTISEGKAKNGAGTFTYSIDFSDSSNVTGSGKIEGIGSEITLSKASIAKMADGKIGVERGDATSGGNSYDYSLGLFKDDASVVAGFVAEKGQVDDKTKRIVGFAGKKVD